MRLRGLAVSALTLLALAGCGEGVPAQDAAALWEQGVGFRAFLADLDERREEWETVEARTRVPEDLLERARAVPGTWRILVVAEDWCGDSIHNLPYLATLADEVEGVELRVVDSRAGKGVMEAHRTPDGRTATPTAVILDGEGAEAGCWVERPAEVQDWWVANPEGLDEDAKVAKKYAFYEGNQGVSALREMVERLEAAAAGAPICAPGGGA